MRSTLNAIYKGSGLLAGFFLVAIALLSLIQIVGRELGFASHSYDEFAGYCMAASSFLGLAWTLRCNEHIRMTLAIAATKGALRRAFEVFSLAVAVAMTGYFAWWSVAMVWTSYSLGDVSQGLVPISLWIPQSGMALGLVALLIAFVDDLLVVALGGTSSYEVAGAAKHAADSPAFER
ncbi:MAG: TRAP transporter small permease [Proteobacteria bacterium]|nr:TRAP transporter small permease [Pseudomonadota bacterium]